MVVAFLLAAGAALLAWAGARRAWAAAGFVALALHVGLTELGRIGYDSYSINAVVTPLLLALLAVFGARAQAGRPRLAGGLALLAGLMLGFAILVRVPVALLVPGFALLLAGARPGLFVAGVLLGGVLPLLVHQDRVAGLWFLPTYGSADAAPPTPFPFLRNLDYYLGTGPAAADNWALAALVFGSLALPGAAGLRWGRAALVLWWLPAAYFLTHKVTTPYYAIPAAFGTAVAIAFAALERGPGPSGWARRALAFVPGLAFLAHLWLSPAPSAVERPAAPPEIALPTEVDERSWIWADALSGSIRYYAGIPAFKITFSDPATRALVQDFVESRGERQYLVEDCPSMVRMREEIVRRGGALQPLGAVAGHPIWRVTWPPPALR